jgi:hypothetical protein
MLEWAGFKVHSVERIGRQHRALAWIILEINRASPRLRRWAAATLATFIARRSKTGNLPPFSVYTGSYAIAQKPGSLERYQELDASKEGWFLPLLVDPVTKSPLQFSNGQMYNDMGEIYESNRGILDLRPKHGLSQDVGRPWAKQ